MSSCLNRVLGMGGSSHFSFFSCLHGLVFGFVFFFLLGLFSCQEPYHRPEIDWGEDTIPSINSVSSDADSDWPAEEELEELEYPVGEESSVDLYWYVVEEVPDLDPEKPTGCTDPVAQNYDADVDVLYDDGSCEYAGGGVPLTIKNTKDTYRNVYVEALVDVRNAESAVAISALYKVEELVELYSKGKNIGNKMIFSGIYPSASKTLNAFGSSATPDANFYGAELRARRFYSQIINSEGSLPIPYINVGQNLLDTDHGIRGISVELDDQLYQVVLRNFRPPHLVDIAIQPLVIPGERVGVRLEAIVSFKLRDVENREGERIFRKAFRYNVFLNFSSLILSQRNAASASVEYRTDYPDLFTGGPVIARFNHRSVFSTNLQQGDLIALAFLKGEAVFSRKVEVFIPRLSPRLVPQLEITVVVYDTDRSWVWNVERAGVSDRVIW
ncbi:MAG: hypothetical protein OXB93_05975 [Cytophagales bacterium]|nr:hypothetical protein [Cytophagales bacterium]